MPPSSPTTARDKGLALVSRVNRWLIAGAVALSAVLSVAAANAFHGRTRGQSATVSKATGTVTHNSSSGGGAASKSGAASNRGAGGLQAPAQAPTAASPPSGGGVVSGAS